MGKLRSARTRVDTLKYEETTRPNTVWYKFTPYRKLKTKTPWP
jgi:hypothetical protein